MEMPDIMEKIVTNDWTGTVLLTIGYVLLFATLLLNYYSTPVFILTGLIFLSALIIDFYNFNSFERLRGIVLLVFLSLSLIPSYYIIFRWGLIHPANSVYLALFYVIFVLTAVIVVSYHTSHKLEDKYGLSDYF